MLTTCRGVITHFNHSTSALKQLQDSQQANNIPKHVLFQDVETKWDSTYQMLKRLHKQRIAIQDVLPSLANFEDATKEPSKESTTLSQAIPIIRSLKYCLNKISNNPSSHPDVRNLANSLFSGLSNRFEFMESYETYLLTTILDPRFKSRIFSTPVVAETARSVLNAAVDDRVVVRPTRPPEEPQPSTSRRIWQACQEIIEEAVSIFSGKTVIRIKNAETNRPPDSNALDVIVVRKKRLIDVIFHVSVATLVSILYINFGCALDWGELRNILKKPVGPAVGFFGQFFIMPVLSYVLGLVLFPESPEMRLGLFFTGVSPGGGASNVWAVVLEGNMSLSIVMTAMSTVAAFLMMPLWIFTLGSLIFDSANLKVPYKQISTYVIALVVPLAIGYLIQRYMKRVAGFMSKILKGFSSCLIVFIIIFAIITNLYLFQLFSWKIILAGMGLPWLGYLLGYLTGKMLKQPHADCLTIAIEVGIQNTGIAIFLLRFALPQPQADLTTIAPVAVAVLTPFPLMILYFSNKLYSRLYGNHAKLNCNDVIVPKNDNNNIEREARALNPA